MPSSLKLRQTYEKSRFWNFIALLKSKSLEPTTLQYVLLGALITVLVYLSFGKSLSIDFGPIDDHEIFRFLGTDRRIIPYQIPEILWHETEIGNWGEAARFRPIYYFLRVLETATFENRAAYWYANRIFILSLTISFLVFIVIESFSAAGRILQICAGLLFATSLLSLSALSEMTMRLGPSETYLVLAFSIFLYSSMKILKGSSRTFFWHLNCLATIIAIGTKESAVALTAPFLYVFIKQVKANHQIRFRIIIQALPVVVLAVLTVVGPMKYISTTGVDVYGSERSFGGSLSLVLSYFQSSSTYENSIAFILIIVCFVIHSYRREEIGKNFRVLLFLTFTLYFGLITEFVFYQGDFTELRYLLITQISSKLLVFLCVVVIFNAIFSTLIKSRTLFGLLVIAIFFVSHQALEDYSRSRNNYIEIGIKNATLTNEYQNKIAEIKIALRSQRYSGIVIQLNSVWDYEPAYAISQYAAFLGNGLPVSINLIIGTVSPGIETILLEQLKGFQDDGSSEWNLESKSQSFQTKNLCIVFNEASAAEQKCLGVLPG